MIIKLNTASSTDYYMFFNCKVDFNQGTVEGGNQVMITRMGGEGNGYSASELLAKLSAGGTWTESSSKIVVEVESIGSQANVKICKEFCLPAYFEVKSDSCETFGYKSIFTTDECSEAAAELGRTVTWGPYGGYKDVVDGCSARFSINK